LSETSPHLSIYFQAEPPKLSKNNMLYHQGEAKCAAALRGQPIELLGNDVDCPAGQNTRKLIQVLADRRRIGEQPVPLRVPT
jgi:hypothetical protein